MKIYIYFLSVFFIFVLFSDIFAREIRINRNIPVSSLQSINYNLFDFTTVQIKPVKKFKYKDYIIISNDFIIFNKVHDNDKYIDFSVTGYDKNKNPLSIEKGDLEVMHLGKSVDYDVLSFNQTNRRALFEIILDDSGSMVGKPIKELKSVVENFMRRYEKEKFDCRVTWFSSTHSVINEEYKKCNSKNFGNLVIRGEYGGTYVGSALQESLNKLNSSNVEYQKYILIVTDGADSTSTRELEELKKLKGDIKIFTYIISDSKGHSLEKITDYAVYNENNFKNILGSYMGSMGDQVQNIKFVRIKKGDLQ